MTPTTATPPTTTTIRGCWAHRRCAVPVESCHLPSLLEYYWHQATRVSLSLQLALRRWTVVKWRGVRLCNLIILPTTMPCATAIPIPTTPVIHLPTPTSRTPVVPSNPNPNHRIPPFLPPHPTRPTSVFPCNFIDSCV